MRIVVAGDSVHWGQGLRREHTFAVTVANELRAQLHHVAHSGAVIGIDDQQNPPAVDGEVPFAYPTIRSQCVAFAQDPSTVDVVLLNGGINDLNVLTLLNPLTSSAYLHAKIVQYCGVDMTQLITAAAGRFTTARLFVTSYFPIFSHESHPVALLRVPAAHLIGAPTRMVRGGDLVSLRPDEARSLMRSRLVELSLQFWRESTEQLKGAVAASHAAGPAAGRVWFVEVPFSERNAMYAPDPWLFALKRNLAPEDEVVSERRAACAVVHQDDPFGAWACSIASVGHPNRKGEAQYAAALLAAIRP